MINLGRKLEEWSQLNASYTSGEIAQQPTTWLKTLAQVKSEKKDIQAFLSQCFNHVDLQIILCGAGTSEFVGNSLVTLLNQKLNGIVRSVSTTDLVLSPTSYLTHDLPTLVVSFGRSGNSPESVAAVELIDQVLTTTYHLFVTCNDHGALSLLSNGKKNCYSLNLTSETHDRGFAMTSSFTNMFLAAYLCFNFDQESTCEKEIEIIAKRVDAFLAQETLCVDLVRNYNFKRIIYLGANALKGIAQESALKMLELTAGQVVVMYETPTGFRHGPKSIVNDDSLIVMYLSDNIYTRQYEIDLLKELVAQRKGNQVLVIGNKQNQEVKALADRSYFFDTEVNDSAMLCLMDIVVAQWISLEKSISLHIGTDNPCPSGEVNRVVQGVEIYPFEGGKI